MGRMTEKQLKTLELVDELGDGGAKFLELRRETNEKQPRSFTQAEALKYLECSQKVLTDLTKALGIDPKRYAEVGIQYYLTLEELYLIRDNMPNTTVLKKRHKPFKRTSKQRTQVIAIQNQKGGVSKTSLANTLGTGLAINYHVGYKICIIDMDGQSTLTSFYPPVHKHETKHIERNGAKYISDARTSIGDLMALEPNTETFQDEVRNAVSDTLIPNLKIIPASQSDRDSESLSASDQLAGQNVDPTTRLKNILDALGGEFDIILIDTPPSLGFATLNSYFAATSVLIPCKAEHNDTDATCAYFQYLDSIIGSFIAKGHQGYDFAKIVISNWKGSDSELDIFNALVSQFGDAVLSTKMKHSEAVKRCASEHSSVFEFSRSMDSKKGKALEAAQANCKEVVADIHKLVTDVWKQQDKGEEQ
ncbi:ParA family protein [uncultured Vibrio sp.]|uniref:ParA family protein n=1 Tax=uncultured Vibrio sp. TaxID=114054 RepID=UPI0026283711|nr:ParA family protein [uncultured Vibrio sp.]